MSKWWELIKISPYEDKRGILKKILKKEQLDGGINIEEVYVLYSNKGSIRGNHYHKKTLEYFTVIKGKARVALIDLSSGEKSLIDMSADDNVVLKVSPNIAHAFENREDEELIILVISSKEYTEKDTDTFIEKLL